MKRTSRLLAALLIACVALPTPAKPRSRAHAPPAPVPEAEGAERVLDTFLRMDADGARLTAEGVLQLGAFLTWQPQPSPDTMMVIDSVRASQVTLAGNSGSATVIYKVVAEERNDLFFHPPEPRFRSVKFRLVFREGAWKVDAFDAVPPCVTRETYHRYVLERISAEQNSPLKNPVRIRQLEERLF